VVDTVIAVVGGTVVIVGGSLGGGGTSPSLGPRRSGEDVAEVGVAHRTRAGCGRLVLVFVSVGALAGLGVRVQG